MTNQACSLNQAFFNKTIAHLRAQNIPAYRQHLNGVTGCCYRTVRDPEPNEEWTIATPPERVLKCAVGAHIPDAVIARHFHCNGDLFDALYEGTMREEIEPIFKGISHELISDLQGLHDSASPPSAAGTVSEPRIRYYATFEGDYFEGAALKIAHDHGLEFEPAICPETMP